MTLTDAGPLIALIDRNEQDHNICSATLNYIQLPMITTWPAFTEALYMLGRCGGWKAQEVLWNFIFRGKLEVIAPERNLMDRMVELMAKYHDVPMDIADASLVVIAEDRNLKRIFTLDSDFHIYRLKDKRALEVIP